MTDSPRTARVSAAMHAMNLLDWAKGSGLVALIITIATGTFAVTHKLDTVDETIAANTKTTAELAVKLDNRETTHTQLLVEVAMLKATYAICCPSARVGMTMDLLTPSKQAKVSDYSAIDQLTRVSAALTGATLTRNSALTSSAVATASPR